MDVKPKGLNEFEDNKSNIEAKWMMKNFMKVFGTAGDRNVLNCLSPTLFSQRRLLLDGQTSLKIIVQRCGKFNLF